MKKILVSVIIINCFLRIQGQIIRINEYGINLYRMDTSEDSQYKQGIHRLYRQDTSGFCALLNISVNKNLDNGAEKLFDTYCCKRIDTVYYDKNFRLSNKNNYRYYDVIQELKYSKDIIGQTHDINDKNYCKSKDLENFKETIGIDMKASNVIALYYLKDSIKYYYFTKESTDISNKDKLADFKVRMAQIFNLKYKKLKTDNDLKEISIYFELLITKNGNISEIKYLYAYPDIQVGSLKQEIEEVIKSNIKYYPNVTPAKFDGKRVNYIYYDFFTY